MNTRLGGAAWLAVLGLVVGCGALSKKNKADAGVEAGVAETLDASIVPAPAMLAANQGDIARFPDETPIASTRNTAQRTFSVREAPPSGTVIGQLTKGTEVTQLASRGPYVLILYEMTPGTQAMGWVHKDAFSASIPDAGTLACPSGESALFSDGPVCGKVCTADGECGAGQACRGSSNKLLPGNKPGEAVKVCTANIVHDAGASASDAGTKAAEAKDAGAPPVPAPDVVPALAGNKCPATFVFVAKTGRCHRPCPAGPSGKECKNQPFFCSTKCGAEKVCTDTKDQCK